MGIAAPKAQYIEATRSGEFGYSNLTAVEKTYFDRFSKEIDSSYKKKCLAILKWKDESIAAEKVRLKEKILSDAVFNKEVTRKLKSAAVKLITAKMKTFNEMMPKLVTNFKRGHLANANSLLLNKLYDLLPRSIFNAVPTYKGEGLHAYFERCDKNLLRQKTETVNPLYKALHKSRREINPLYKALRSSK